MGDMAEFREVLALLKTGVMKPVIDRVYKPADAMTAYAPRGWRTVREDRG